MRKLLLVSVVGACTSSSDTTSTQVTGQAADRDADTDASGQPRQAAKPSFQVIVVQLTTKGVGSSPQVDPCCPCCATASVGAFQAHYASTARISSADAYIAAARRVFC